MDHARRGYNLSKFCNWTTKVCKNTWFLRKRVTSGHVCFTEKLFTYSWIFCEYFHTPARKHGEDLQLNWPVKWDTFLRNWSSFGLSAALMMAASNKPRFPQNTVLKPCPPKTWGVAICSFKSFPCLPYLGSSTRDLPFSRIFLRINMK